MLVGIGLFVVLYLCEMVLLDGGFRVMFVNFFWIFWIELVVGVWVGL